MIQVEWSITGVLRQFYTLQEHDIVSKVDACKYAIHHLPEEYHNIINEAISIREGSNKRYCHSKNNALMTLFNVWIIYLSNVIVLKLMKCSYHHMFW